MSGTGNPGPAPSAVLAAEGQVAPGDPSAGDTGRGTLAGGAAPPLGQPNTKATSRERPASRLPSQPSRLSTAEPPQASAAKSKSSCSLPHLLLTCHSAFPRAARPVTFNQLPMPAGGAQVRVQHSPPGSAQKDSSDTSPPQKLARPPPRPPATASRHMARCVLRARHGGCQHVSLHAAILDTRPVKHGPLHSHWIARGQESSGP